MSIREELDAIAANIAEHGVEDAYHLAAETMSSHSARRLKGLGALAAEDLLVVVVPGVPFFSDPYGRDCQLALDNVGIPGFAREKGIMEMAYYVAHTFAAEYVPGLVVDAPGYLPEVEFIASSVPPQLEIYSRLSKHSAVQKAELRDTTLMDLELPREQLRQEVSDSVVGTRGSSVLFGASVDYISALFDSIDINPMHDGPDRFRSAVDWIKQDLEESIASGDIQEMAHMSRATFDAHLDSLSGKLYLGRRHDEYLSIGNGCPVRRRLDILAWSPRMFLSALETLTNGPRPLAVDGEVAVAPAV